MLCLGISVLISPIALRAFFRLATDHSARSSIGLWRGSLFAHRKNSRTGLCYCLYSQGLFIHSISARRANVKETTDYEYNTHQN